MNIIIIGCSGGIGKQLVSDLKENHNLFLGYHNNKPDFDYPSHQVNADDFDSLMSFVKKGKESMESVDALICLPGTLILKPAHKCTEEDFKNTVSNNFKAAFSAVRASGELLRDCAVILMSTAAASIGLANHEAIAAAKGGLEGFTKSAAATYAKNNIRVNALALGLVESNLSNGIVSNQAALEISKKMHSIGKIGSPEIVAKFAVPLITDNSSWITGSVINIDGGLSTTKLAS